MKIMFLVARVYMTEFCAYCDAIRVNIPFFLILMLSLIFGNGVMHANT